MFSQSVPIGNKRARDDEVDDDEAYEQLKADFEQDVCCVGPAAGLPPSAAVDNGEEESRSPARLPPAAEGGRPAAGPFLVHRFEGHGQRARFVRMDLAALKRHAASMIVPFRAPGGERVTGPLFVERWMRDPGRRRYVATGFFPDPKDCPAGCFNLFVLPRFIAAPAPDFAVDFGFVDFVLEHISRVVGDGDRLPAVETVRGKPFCREAQIVLDFLAFCVQHYGKKTWMLWLCGRGNTDGKSAIVELLRGVLGTHVCSSSRGGRIGPKCPLLGKYNAQLEGALLVDFEVEDAVLPAYGEKLRSLITVDRVAIRRRRERGDEGGNFVPSFHKVIATCSYACVVPRALLQAPARCAVVVPCDRNENGDRHFARMREVLRNIDNGDPEWTTAFASLAAFLRAREIVTDMVHAPELF